jgi:mRNA interferase MazF
MNINRGDLLMATLDPVVGREIAKTRPVLVISNDINNLYAGTVTILPITSKNLEKIFPFEVFIPKGRGNLPKNSKVKTDQVRTIDQKRLIKFIGKLNEIELEAVDQALKIHLGLI